MNRTCLIACLLLALSGCQSAPEPAPAGTADAAAPAAALAEAVGDSLRAQVEEFERGLRPLQTLDGSKLRPAYTHLAKWRGRLAAALRTWDMAQEAGDMAVAAERAQAVFPQLETARADLLEARLHWQAETDRQAAERALGQEPSPGPSTPEEWR